MWYITFLNGIKVGNSSGGGSSGGGSSGWRGLILRVTGHGDERFKVLYARYAAVDLLVKLVFQVSIIY